MSCERVLPCLPAAAPRSTRAPARCSKRRSPPTLLRLAAPNVLVMIVQASVGLIETYFVG